MGYFIIFNTLQYQAKTEIKRSIKNNLPQNKLTVIAVPIKEIPGLDWYEDNQEFRYQGKMYDIVRSETKNNIRYYYCINDTQEDDLFASLGEHISKHVNQDVSHNKNTKNVIQKVIKDYYFEQCLRAPGIFSIRLQYAHTTSIYCCFSLTINSPPPKTIS